MKSRRLNAQGKIDGRPQRESSLPPHTHTHTSPGTLLRASPHLDPAAPPPSSAATWTPAALRGRSSKALTESQGWPLVIWGRSLRQSPGGRGGVSAAKDTGIGCERHEPPAGRESRDARVGGPAADWTAPSSARGEPIRNAGAGRSVGRLRGCLPQRRRGGVIYLRKEREG